MRKQTKVLAAAALFTLGASFSAFAAKTGTWVLEDDGWYCYDKDGDAYEEEWCLSNGKEFYVGDDGLMVTSDWVEYDGAYYYVNSAGEKIANDWKLVTPVDDEDADEEWFFFKSSGKRAASEKRTIDGKTYYFNNEGVMLTGWVDKANLETADDSTEFDKLVYCDENGARVSKTWINTYAPEVDVEEDDLDDYDPYYYYCGSKGAPVNGKQSNINGQTYFFDEEGKMLSGWVALLDNGTYKEIGGEEDAKSEVGLSAYEAVYFCGDSDDGHAKKNKWIKEWKNTQYDAADADNSKKWFWIAKDGKVFVPETPTDANAVEVSFEEGTLVDGTKGIFAVDKVLNDKTYAFNENGEMLSGLVRIDGLVYYYGGSDDGSRKTGTLTIEDDCDDAYKFCFATETKSGYVKAAGVTGAKGGKLYNDGLLVTADDYKYRDADVVIGDVTYYYIVNGSGSIQTSKKVYKDDDVIIKDATVKGFTFDDGKGMATLKGSYTIEVVEAE